MAPNGFMTNRRGLFQRISHHCDLMLRCIHVFVGSDDFCRLPDPCVESATEFARALEQRTAKESSSEGSVTWQVRGSVRRAFLGNLREKDFLNFSGRLRLHGGGPCRRALGYSGPVQA